MSSLSCAAVCFIVCHGGPADHFAIYAKELEKRGCPVQIFASGPALKKLQDQKILEVTAFDWEDRSEEEAAEEIAKRCARSMVAITDVGHLFDIAMQRALAQHAPNSVRWAYYDNPESNVPGGYSAVASKVMNAAQGVLFANANLAESFARTKDLAGKRCFGVGYFPLEQAEKIAQRRAQEHQLIRSQILTQCHLEDRGQKILIYSGGNNEAYFSQAFPAFLRFVSAASQENDLTNFVILLQQHPGAKKENRDGLILQNWLKQNEGKASPRFFLSQWSSDDAQTAADAILYYQTSMGPQFALAEIPAIQVGDDDYEDLLVKNHLCSVVKNEKELIQALKNLEPHRKTESSRQIIMQGLGVRLDWRDRLHQIISKSGSKNYWVKPATATKSVFLSPFQRFFDFCQPLFTKPIYHARLGISFRLERTSSSTHPIH
jgi:hypothetical protein